MTRWRSITNYVGYYEVSDDGQVRSVISGPITPKLDPSTGRASVRLERNGYATNSWVANLVANTFVGPCPPGQVIHHRDRNLTNCAATNLTWIDKDDPDAKPPVTIGTGYRKTQCKRGHPYIGPNTRYDETGTIRRGCRACDRALALRRRGIISTDAEVQKASDTAFREIASGDTGRCKRGHRLIEPNVRTQPSRPTLHYCSSCKYATEARRKNRIPHTPEAVQAYADQRYREIMNIDQKDQAA